MTHTWGRWLSGSDERSSRSYDFIEAPPVVKRWWFRIGVALICISFLWLFWLIL